jgi:hypothetical protein
MSQSSVFKIILAVCIVASLAGILVAVCVTKDAADGGRGGAIADAIALSVMLVSRNYAARLYKIITRLRSESKEEYGKHDETAVSRTVVRSIVKNEIDSLLNLLNVDAQSQKLQNRYLATATCIGTLFWGFGDWIARQFLAH